MLGFPIPRITLVLVAATLSVHLLPQAFEAMRFAILTPTIFQTIASHFVHCSTSHLLWSGGAFAALGWLCERREPLRYPIVLASSSLLIPGALLLSSGSFATYAGLSGIDSALFGLVGVSMVRESLANRERATPILATLLLAGFVVKIASEFATGTSVFASGDNGMVPVPLAHIVGMGIGLASGMIPIRARRKVTRVNGSRQSKPAWIRTGLRKPS